jgi:hypothetical protein
MLAFDNDAVVHPGPDWPSAQEVQPRSEIRLSSQLIQHFCRILADISNRLGIYRPMLST